MQGDGDEHQHAMPFPEFRVDRQEIPNRFTLARMDPFELFLPDLHAEMDLDDEFGPFFILQVLALQNTVLECADGGGRTSAGPGISDARIFTDHGIDERIGHVGGKKDPPERMPYPVPYVFTVQLPLRQAMLPVWLQDAGGRPADRILRAVDRRIIKGGCAKPDDLSLQDDERDIDIIEAGGIIVGPEFPEREIGFQCSRKNVEQVPEVRVGRRAVREEDAAVMDHLSHNWIDFVCFHENVGGGGSTSTDATILFCLSYCEQTPVMNILMTRQASTSLIAMLLGAAFCCGPVAADARAASEDSLLQAANTLSQQAKTYMKEGNYAAAIDYLIGIPLTPYHDQLNPMARFPDVSVSVQSAIDQMARSPFRDYLQARVYGYLSTIYLEIGDSARAFHYSLQYRGQLRKLQPLFANEYQEASLYLGEQYLFRGRADSAGIILSGIGQDISQRKDSTNYAGYLHFQGYIAAAQNRLQAAIDLYDQAFATLKTRKQKWPEYYRMALELGHLLMQTRQFSRADSVFRRNCQVLQNIQYTSAIREQMLEGFVEDLLYLQQFDSAQTELTQLTRFMFSQTYSNSKGLSEQEEYYFSLRLDRLFDLLYTFYYKNVAARQPGKLDLLFFEVQRKSLVYMNRRDLLNQNYPYRENDIPLPYGHLHRTRELIARQYSLPAYRRWLSIDSLQALAEGYERKIAIRGFGLNPEDNRKSEAMRFSTQLEGTDRNIEYIRFNYLSPDTPQGIPLYAALVFDNNSSRTHLVPLCRESEILQLLKDDKGGWLEGPALSKRLYDSSSRNAAALYRLIWQPVEPYLDRGEGIAYSPAGVLNNIAFNAIYNGEEYLINKYRLLCILSFLEVGNVENPYERPESVSLWGNIDYEKAVIDTARIPYPRNSAYYFSEKMYRDKEMKDKGMTGWTGMPVWREMHAANGVASGPPVHAVGRVKGISTDPFPSLGPDEVIQLQRTLALNHIPFRSHTLSRATEEELKDSSDRIKGVLHISTHGFYVPYDPTKAGDTLPGNFIAAVPDPQLRCGLTFSGANYYWRGGIPASYREDGVLTGLEISQLDLRTVKLVTLSACETGLGDLTENEGNLGLQRAFKLAGVRYLLVSLWEVPANITARLVNQFYRNWLSGEALPDALEHAQIDIRLHAEAAPYFWAGFVLVE